MENGKNERLAPYPFRKIHFLDHQHHLGENESVKDRNSEWFKGNIVLCENNRLVIGEQGEEHPQIEEHGKHFLELGESSFG